MAENGEAPAASGAGRLDTLAAAAADGPARIGRDAWNPPFCGDIPMRIARDGTWHYDGSPIARPALVRLFAGVLRRDDGRFFLVTPVEKVGIEVEDAPFLAVAMEADDATLRLRTNLDDWIDVGPAHPLRFEPGPAGGVKPYVHVRGDLWALLTRALAADLVEMGETRRVDGADLFGIAAGGAFFPIGPAADAD